MYSGQRPEEIDDHYDTVVDVERLIRKVDAQLLPVLFILREVLEHLPLKEREMLVKRLSERSAEIPILFWQFPRMGLFQTQLSGGRGSNEGLVLP